MEQEKSNTNSLKESNYNQNKFSIAEIPTFSQIKESRVREKLGSGFTSIHVKRCAISPRQARFFLVVLPRGSQKYENHSKQSKQVNYGGVEKPI